MKKPITNPGASVRARLLELSRSRRIDFQRVLQRYAIERVLYRLGASRNRDNFVLKGATLFILWDESLDRPTKDLDFAGYWSSDPASLEAAFREIFEVPCPDDGLLFDLGSLRLEPIRDQHEYHGFRLSLKATLDGASIPLQIDVGFGDTVIPPPALAEFPILLKGPVPQVKVYSREMAIAEKLHAMVSHGLANSRMKDFFDIFVLSRRFGFAGETLLKSIEATFSGRKQNFDEELPPALSAEFYVDRADFWRGFQRRFRAAEVPSDFPEVGEQVRAFLLPAWQKYVERGEFDGSWPPAGPWSY